VIDHGQRKRRGTDCGVRTGGKMQTVKGSDVNRLTGASFRLIGAKFRPRGFRLTGAFFWLAYWSDILAH